MNQQPIKVVDTATGLVLFDGLQAVMWMVLMKQSIAASGVRVKNMAPGQLYTFIFQQDAIGGFTFDWPGHIQNGGIIDPAPDAISVQNFIGNTSGILIANLPGTWGNR